jgi:hypothetical protein
LPLLELPKHRVEAASGQAALTEAPLAKRLRDHTQARYSHVEIDNSPGGAVKLRCWYAPGDGPDAEPAQLQQIWDRRDFSANRFEGGRRIVQGSIAFSISTGTTPSEGAT